jgi:hypothetical protein
MTTKETYMQGRSSTGAWPLAAVRLAFLALACAFLLAAAPTPAADTPAKGTPDTSIKITPFPPSVQVDTSTPDEDETDRRHRRHRAAISIDSDKDFESFKEAMETAPWIVGLIFLVVGSIFLTPVILLIGIVWYKLRKTRLQNEALLKLAERGVMPSAQAVDAVTSGVMPTTHALDNPAPAAAQAPAAGTAEIAAGAMAYQQAVATRRRAVWSDLRKGVLLCAVGLSFVMYSLIASSSPNWIGFALLFVGIAYVILWRLEDRHISQRAPDKAPDRQEP